MSYIKKIVCLANSRKMSGRCIAGKEVLDNGFGEWIRPISNRGTAEISEEEMRFENGETPQLLDIISVPMLEHKPHHYQTENHLIDDRCYWESQGKLSLHELPSLCDVIEDSLWINGHRSYYGVNDRIPVELANGLNSSLLLIYPEELFITIDIEGAEFGNAKRKVRSEFTLNRLHYKLVVTDPKVERTFLKKANGRYKIPTENVYLCISIGEPYSGYCYKLVAAIIGIT